MYVRKFYVVRRPEDDGAGAGAGAGGAAEFDLSAAMDSIAADMAEASAPAPAPAPTAGPSPAPAPNSAAPEGQGDSAAVKPEGEGAAAPAPAPAPTDALPKSWRPELAEKWATLDPAVKAEVLRREEDIFRGIEAYKADAAFGKPIKAAMDPYMPILEQYGINPADQVRNLMNAHYTLSFGTPEQKAGLLRQLAQDYGVPLPGAAEGEAAFVDPQVQALQQELAQLKSQLAGFQRTQVQSVQERLRSEVEAFAAKPENDLFDKVAVDMALLIKADRNMTLEQAYQRATWANPETRQILLDRKLKADAEAQAKAQQEHAARAAQAAKATVKSAPKSASATTPSGSIDDTLRETLEEINSRGR